MIHHYRPPRRLRVRTDAALPAVRRVRANWPTSTPSCPVYRQLTGDTLTPVSAFCKIQEGDWSFLFESVVGGERIGRYSFLGAGPFLTFEAYGNRAADSRRRTRRRSRREAADPLKLLEEMIATYRAPNLPGLPRFCGGAVGYAGYDTVRYVGTLPNAPPDDRNIPDLCFGFYDRMVIFDHVAKTVLVVAHGFAATRSREPEPD